MGVGSTVKAMVPARVKAVVPKPLIVAVRAQQTRLAMRAAQRAFSSAPTEPAWLEPSELERLESRFEPPPTYSYDREAIDQRAAERASYLASLVDPGGSTLEVGSGDGMVSHALMGRGFTATAIDLAADRFHARAVESGVRFVNGDASAMPFDEHRFDLVASYNAFEHFADPGQVLSELIRITRPGGTIHLAFGPLYFSAWGLHGYRSVHTPYSHLLFERPVLERYVEERGLKPIPFDTLNGWPIGRYRRLFADHADELETVGYVESPQIAGRALIAEHPSCFRAKTDDFDDLLLASIRATFRVRARS
jgi:SAM-dependent methyltransferase